MRLIYLFHVASYLKNGQHELHPFVHDETEKKLKGYIQCPEKGNHRHWRIHPHFKGIGTRGIFGIHFFHTLSLYKYINRFYRPTNLVTANKTPENQKRK